MEQTQNENEEQISEQPECAIIFVFSGEGSSQFGVQKMGIITPTQLLALAGWLEFEANWALSQERMQKQVQIANVDQTKQILRP